MRNRRLDQYRRHPWRLWPYCRANCPASDRPEAARGRARCDLRRISPPNQRDLISGTVKRIVRGATLIVDLGKVEAILPDRFYPKIEQYNVGDRVQALLYEVRDTENGGAEVILSRSHPEFVRQLFLQEVPELEDGTVTIEQIVRDAGYRTKLAVTSSDPRVDPVGACVGVRGTASKM